MPRHFTETEKADIYQKIIDVGLELFEKLGIDKTSVGDITDRVGISKGSFYNFFNSKGDLFMEIYRLERERAHRETVEKITNGTTELSMMLRKYLNEMMARIHKRPILEIVYDSNALMMISDKQVRERLLQYNMEINQEITKMIQEWMDRDGQYGVDAHIVAKMLRSINFLKFHDYAIGLEDFDKVVETLTSAVCEYVENSKI